MLTLSQELKRRGFEKGLEEGRLAGIQEGQQEGILKNKLETAEALLKENMSVEKISQITGLPLKDIKKLMKDVHQ